MTDNDFLKTAVRTAACSRLAMTDAFLQHGNTSCLLHTVAVAYYSYRFFTVFKRFKVHRADLIRGALLHDYFLYDWHIPERAHSLHGFRHPKTALTNAQKDLFLTEIEKDIIEKHMFPLTLRPPRYRESIVVCLADKICSVHEIFHRNPYRNRELRQAYANIKKS